MLRLKSSLIIVHIAGWLLFMAFPLLFLNGPGNTGNGFLLLRSVYYWLFGLTFIALFYINTLFLIPRFFLRKKYVDYSIGLIVLLCAVYFLQPFDKLLRASEARANMPVMQAPPASVPGQMPPTDGMPPPGAGFRPGDRPRPPRRHIDSTSLFIFIMVVALGTAAKTIQQWQLTEQRAALAEAGRASAELSFLKAQINPHFLFNTLNNIYTLAVTNSGYTADSIMKLSNIMRYVTDEATEDFVALKNEIDCISDYIELQKLRTGKNTTVNFEVAGNTSGKTIAPIILMSFVENVFKYGVSKNIASDIDISILVTQTEIIFTTSNQIFEGQSRRERTGIGISNTRQRLQHLYAGKHLLNILNKNSKFTVELTLWA